MAMPSAQADDMKTDEDDGVRSVRSVRSAKRYLPLLAITAAAAILYFTGLYKYISLEAINTHRETLEAYVADQPLLAGLGFTAAYVIVAALGLPIAVFLTLTGGLLFGPLIGTVCVVVGATLGATLVFMATKTALRDTLTRRAGSHIRAFQDGFNRDAFSYMLVLRLVPLFPFFLVNLVPGLLGVRLRTYVLATFIGIIPGSAVYVSVGNGLGALLDAGQQPDLGVIFQPAILLPLVGLALLSLVPIIYKRLKARKG